MLNQSDFHKIGCGPGFKLCAIKQPQESAVLHSNRGRQFIDECASFSVLERTELGYDPVNLVATTGFDLIERSQATI